ncbi:MAG: MFS transporter [Gemmataceae bacterium]
MATTQATPTAAPPMGLGLRLNLSVMMFLQFAIWGAWFSVLGNYLGALKFSPADIGMIYGTMALGTIFAPLFVGQIADRYFPSQILMALLHLAGAGALYYLATIKPTGDTAEAVAAASSKFYWVALGYALIYSPTLALSNSIAFTHIPDGTRDFPGIRVLGTIGWIAAGLIVGKVLAMPEISGKLAEIAGISAEAAKDPKTTNLPILLAAAFSALLGLWSFILPHTPPKGQAGDTIPFLRALGLLGDPLFAVFFGVSFVITIVLAFYYGFTGLWLEKKMGVQDVASTMTIGQWSEMLLLPFLPFFLKRFGMKGVLAFGMLAWGVRYAWFAYIRPIPVELGGLGIVDLGIVLPLALHGICYDFFFAAAFIHVDNESPPEIRGSAQALFTFLTYGLGMWIGNVLSGKVAEYYKNPTTGEIDWQQFWIVPSAGVLVSLLIFLVAFRTRPAGQKAY